MATTADAGIPAAPPRLRPRPQHHDIGVRYADEQAFLADEQAWQAERAQREELMRQRQRAQHRARDRDRKGRQRSADDNNRRVAQRRAANPNVMPQEVVDAFLELDDPSRGCTHWCADDLDSPTAIANGLPPPQCLVDFLAGGGSANARAPSTNDRCRMCMRTPSLCTAHRKSLHVRGRECLVQANDGFKPLRERLGAFARTPWCFVRTRTTCTCMRVLRIICAQPSLRTVRFCAKLTFCALVH